ncbi:hypothetical protein BDB00DRAFT_859657 [Zychaea mexicana]|uniref:uncharacterized protein n=1 Tax=Zychaea mexicana TaxID=64656 RepID=UPI0022FEEC4D|nr:uncharacterized protein BDB00DRAFT_859657 [Zychaea mexicana]KAI9477063.1 hypothetical protein BDB00DRAFT_859657 [Zychaea mexicana]
MSARQSNSLSSTNNNITSVNHTMDRSNAQSHIPKNNSTRNDSVLSGTSIESAITIVDEPSSPSIDDLLEDLQSLSIQNKSDPAPVESRTLTKEYLAAKKAALEKIQSPLAKKWDDLYEKTSLAKAPSVKPLTDDEAALVENIMRNTSSRELAQLKTAIVQYSDIQKLRPGVWLNDEIINFYMELIADRSRSEDAAEKKLPSVHCYNTFFCSTLRDQGYAKVRRWTKRVDVFAKDLLFVPINYAYHWTLGMIDMKHKKITVYDSMGGSHRATLQLLLKYLADEHQDKKKQSLNMSGWETGEARGIPLQANMHDCGVFTCTFAERLSRQNHMDFTQADMELIRKRMVLSIAKQEIV